MEDVNDNVPAFEREQYRCQLTELPAQAQFVTLVRAHDPDPSDRLRYSITAGNDQQLFYIDKHSGKSNERISQVTVTRASNTQVTETSEHSASSDR